MYNSLPWEEDITRADALRRAGTTAPLRGFYCFQLKRKKKEKAQGKVTFGVFHRQGGWD